VKEENTEGDLKELTSVRVTCSLATMQQQCQNIRKGRYDQLMLYKLCRTKGKCSIGGVAYLSIQIHKIHIVA
jgi:hypothetical protein